MSARFRAFTFVDRLDELVPGGSARGSYVVPPSVGEFPASLAAEAVGQLVAWSVMAALDFSFRPVAGIAGRIEFGDPPQAGETLELSGTIDDLNDQSVRYHGEVRSGGRMIIRLFDCIGPLLPMEEFDDPEAVRAHCERLRAGDAAGGGFEGIPDLPLVMLPTLNGEATRAEFAVPDDLHLFGDHFPRRPVLPGTPARSSSGSRRREPPRRGSRWAWRASSSAASPPPGNGSS